MLFAVTIATWFVLSFAVAILQGFVLATLWAWFVVPTFNCPQLTIPVAIGLITIVALVDSSKSKIDKSDDLGEGFTRLVSAAAQPFILLAVGFVVHRFQ